jgi:radical SAM superfamily enzyme YgiQ (UPF0313 family)
MKIDIIICYIPRYNEGHLVNFVPPITGIHLAAITPAKHDVRVYHQQVENIDLKSNADIIAISFFSGFAPMAYQLANFFRSRSKTVVAGGPHVSFNISESLEHFDAILIGEAENQWEQMLNDIESDRLKRIYRGTPQALCNLPTPRYDLVSGRYFLKKVVQATRGCYYNCSFCTVPYFNPGYRMRPVEDVIRDAAYDHFRFWWQKKVVWFWDDNLLINRKFTINLLHEMIPLNKWWLTQASIDIAKDKELLKLMRRSGCIGIFIGIETFSKSSLKDANKNQNRIDEYRSAIKQFHRYGICVMAGLITGFDSDTSASISQMAFSIRDLRIDVPFISILTPFKGTPLYSQLQRESRILNNRDWKYYNGYNVSFRPKLLSVASLHESHRKLWKKSFSFSYSVWRIIRSMFYLRPGAFLICLFMNVFYGLKGITGNLPRDMAFSTLTPIIDHDTKLFTDTKNNRA